MVVVSVSYAGRRSGLHDFPWIDASADDFTASVLRGFRAGGLLRVRLVFEVLVDESPVVLADVPLDLAGLECGCAGSGGNDAFDQQVPHARRDGERLSRRSDGGAVLLVVAAQECVGELFGGSALQLC